MKIMILKYILLVKINMNKSDMYSKAKRFGLSDPRVIASSQNLDSLLNTYQNLSDKNFRMYATHSVQFMNYH